MLCSVGLKMLLVLLVISGTHARTSSCHQMQTHAHSSRGADRKRVREEHSWLPTVGLWPERSRELFHFYSTRLVHSEWLRNW